MSALVGTTAGGGVLRHGYDALAPDRPAELARLRTFHTLDALRGIAAINVVLFHAAFFYSIGRPAEGQLAVDLFFVMSGFIIAHRYDDELRSGLTLRRFAAIRLIRLYPLFLLGVCLGAVPPLEHVLKEGWTQHYGGQIEALPMEVLMLPSRSALPYLQELYPLNTVAWSLALEIAVNLAYAATARFWTTPRLVVLVGLSAVGLAAGAAVYGTLHAGFDWDGAIVGPARILFGFPVGFLIQRAYRAAPERFPRVAWWIPLAIASALFVMPPLGGRALWDFAACTTVVPLIVVLAVTSEPPRRLRGLCAVAGIGSYVLYSLHIPLVGLYLRLEQRLHADLDHQSLLGALGFTVLLIVACACAHQFYDKPIRRYLTRLLAQAGTRYRGDMRAAAKN